VLPGGDESTVRALPEESSMRAVPAASTLGWDSEPSTVETGSADHDRLDPFVVDGPIETGTPAYDETFAGARRDLRALATRTDHGPVPLAGAPWFVTVFGRDALLASYLSLPVAPSLAAGTLRYLAAHQGRNGDDARDEAPGKILHEVRRGELARTRAIPQTPYYGSVDATPLWVTLLHETWRWTGDDGLVTDLWATLEAALDRLERAVAAVGENPFLYYRSTGAGGVVHKLWRDSANGVQYADGRGAEPPLAGAAVQGYLHDALDRAADLAAAVRGDEEHAADLAERAEALAAAFDEAFWLPERRFYAAALTADERRVDAVTSTAGHCLWAGVVPDRRAGTVAERLLEPDLSSGWGLRTLGADEAGYSPTSYHAGGVWPHDNAIAALGLARYGCDEAAAAVAADQFDAFAALDGRSLPELFCGFDDASPPVPYPSACRPQAWAAASPYGLLRALSDLEPGTGAATVAAPGSHPVAPDAVDPVADHWGGS
jgi:glycogen debranching enzyme